MITRSLLQLKIDESPGVFARTLAEEGDVFWWAKGNFWVVTSYDLAKIALFNPLISCDRSSFFISRMPELDLSLVSDFFNVVGKMMVMSDGKSHALRRQVASHGISAPVLDSFRPKVERTVTKLLQAVEAAKSFDFVARVARQIPSTVLADLYSIKDEDRENFYLWSDEMTQFFGGSSSYTNNDGIRVNAAARNLKLFFERLIAQRRVEPQDDFVTKMIHKQAQLGLTDDEVVSQAIMMLVAGQVTTTDQICNNLYQLLTIPGAFSCLQAQPHLLAPALEEFTRLDPAVTFIFRVAREDTQIGQQAIRAGDVIFISTHAVNRDSRVFEEPNTFNPRLTRQPHLGFGYGAHYCLGAALARLEMETLFRQILEKFPGLNFELAFPPARKHHSLSFSGFESLTLRTVTHA